MDFGYALNALKEGAQVTRSGWNGKGMFLFLFKGTTLPRNKQQMGWLEVNGLLGVVLPYIVMVTVEGDLVPWLASQTDLLADDWSILEA
jgi:hypothetical protein